MPRPCRIHVPGALYHAVLRGNHQQPIFSGAGDYGRFEDIVARAVDRYGASLIAYCWMTNHVHLAVRIGDAPLGRMLAVVASRYARAKQRTLATTGHLFERRYRARLVDADRYLLALVRYIHLNPVRAQLVADPRDYPWCSHRVYLGAPCPEWLQPDVFLRILAPSAPAALSAYEQLMRQASSETERAAITVEFPRAATANGAHARSEQPARDEPRRAPVRHAEPRSLDAIAAEVAAEHGITTDDVVSPRRHRGLVDARREIAKRALIEGAATLAQVARHLNRAPSTLSDLLNDPR